MIAEVKTTRTRPSDNIDWTTTQRVLVVKLRSIGDTVLATPSLIALRRFFPHARIDILLEDWVAPLLIGFDAVDNVISVRKGAGNRLRTAFELARTRYDVAFNLHGGTTATFFTAARRTLRSASFDCSIDNRSRVSWNSETALASRPTMNASIDAARIGSCLLSIEISIRTYVRGPFR